MARKSSHPLGPLMVRSRLNVLGINSGTSIDGLDVCLVEIRDRLEIRPDIAYLKTRSYRFPPQLRKTLRALAADARIDKAAVAGAHMQLADWAGTCVQRFVRTLESGVSIDLIGFHGQTIGHFPKPDRRRRSAKKVLWQGDATWQIGAASLIAQRTGIVTVGDFRTADIAAGGMGAPLSGYYHHLMFGTRHVALNLGGIANVSVSRARDEALRVLAFDVGPGNMVADAVSHLMTGHDYDQGGRLAARGKVDPRVVKRALRHPYFRRPPPKTCGREEFGEPMVKRWFGRRLRSRSAKADCAATALAITVSAIGTALHLWVEPFSRARSLIVSGGGVKNKTLMRRLRAELKNWEVGDTTQFGLDPKYVEPAGFALLAHETVRGRPGNLGGATGGAPAILGTIALPPE